MPFTEIHKNNEIALHVCKILYCEDVPILLMLEIQFIIWLVKRKIKLCHLSRHLKTEATGTEVFGMPMHYYLR